MRSKAETQTMPIFPLFVIGTMMLAIVLYLAISQALMPQPRGTRVYIPSAYGISDEPSSVAAPPSEFTFEKPRLLLAR